MTVMNRFQHIFILVFALSLLGWFGSSQLVYAAESTSNHQNTKSVVNINQANAATIAKAIRGIGKKRASDIVKYRDKHGPFKSVSDLANVRGINKRLVKKLDSQLTT